MSIKNWFKPFEKIDGSNKLTIIFFWLISIMLFWTLGTLGEKKLFPPPLMVWQGFYSLYNEGLVHHVMSSLYLALQATLISLAFSLIIVYLSPIPFVKPIVHFLSKFRYLPLTGLTFYITMVVSSARTMQIWVLVIFMSLYLITTLLGILKDISEEEIDHARSLNCSRWEIVWEVIVKGRLDYVIEALRQNLAIIWMMLVTVESILVSAGGLGVLIKNSDRFVNHGRIVALQIVILIVGLVLDIGLQKLRKMLFRYSTF